MASKGEALKVWREQNARTPFATLLSMAAGSEADFASFLARAVHDSFGPGVRGPKSLHDWSGFYRHHNYLDLRMMEFIAGPRRPTDPAAPSRSLTDRLMHSPLMRLVSTLESPKTMADMPYLFDDEDVGDILEDVELPSLHAVIFFCEVYIPCAITLETNPVSLYQRAINGDITAASELLRLDKRIITDRLFARLWYDVMNSRNKAKKELLLSSLHSPFSGKFEIGRMKLHSGAIIQVVAQLEGSSIKPSQIRALFDAIAQDRDGSLRDFDLPSSDAAFYKGLARARQAYQRFIESTITIDFDDLGSILKPL